METIRCPFTSRNHSSLSLRLLSDTMQQSAESTPDISNAPKAKLFSYIDREQNVLNISAHCYCYLWKTLIYLDTMMDPGPGQSQGGTLEHLSVSSWHSGVGWWFHLVTVPVPMSCVSPVTVWPRVWMGGTDINHRGKVNHSFSDVFCLQYTTTTYEQMLNVDIVS